MAPPTIYIAITNHGFGHATRAAAIAATLHALMPDLQIILTTTAPRWLLESYLDAPFTLRERAFDVGVLQRDSLTMDKAATLAALHDIQQQQPTWIEAEAAFLMEAGVDLVLADIPPLAAPIARAAGVPCWMISNFGWDFIYRAWGGEFAAIADWIADCFDQCDRLFRLPFHEPMSAFRTVTDVGLTGGTPRFSEEALRSRWHLDTPTDQTVLLTFGGLGLAQIPYAGLSQFPDWQFITFDRAAPDLPNLLKIGDRALRPVDLMPLCGRVVSKPGYSTFSEACRLDIPIVTLTRDDFAEAPLLIEGVRHASVHQILTPDEFFEGDWEFLHRPLSPPSQPRSLNKAGNRAVAQAVLNFFSQPTSPQLQDDSKENAESDLKTYLKRA